MEVKKLKTEEISEWYHNYLLKDFPENEAKPLDNIVELVNSGRYNIYVYYDSDEICGYATIWKRPGFITFLLDYLGVPSHLRNRGIGRDILDDIRERLVQEEGRSNISMILESETPTDDSDPENEIRKRRIGFYRRNGFVELYEMGTCGVRFTTFSYMEVPSDIELTMMEHKEIYGEEREDVIVPLERGVTPPVPFWMKQMEIINEKSI